MNARSGLVSLLAKPGTFWAKMSAQPAWVQFRFPKPVAAASAEFRFQMDERYAPTAGGGNPCHRAPTGNCTLCSTHLNGGPWDFSVAPGIRLLWSYPSASKHYIDPEPVDVFGAFVDGALNLYRSSPPGLDLRNQTEVVVTVLSFNQYPHYSNSLEDNAEYDPADPARCSVEWNRNADTDQAVTGNILLSLLSVSLVTRSYWNPAQMQAPPAQRPRLFGGNAEWLQASVDPFLEKPCVRTDAWSPGWGGDSGVPDFKGHFERSVLGFSTCKTGDVRPESIMDHASVKASYATTGFKSFSGASARNKALQVFHLLRRLRACHATGLGAPCQFNSTETDRLAEAVVVREMALFSADAVQTSEEHWGWEQTTDGCCGFDLFTAESLKHYSLFLDVLGDVAVAHNSTFYHALAGKMRSYILDYVGKFSEGDWALWNGNNWTPVLSEGVMHWAIAFWHEEPELARQAVHIVNDISLLHQDMWLESGVYKEGVCQYSLMSIRSSLALGVLYARAFNEPWASVSAQQLAKAAQWHLDSYDTAGYAIDFGDSHACRGTEPATLFAAYSVEVLAPLGAPRTSAVDPCLVREWAAMAYYVTVHDPWQFYAVLATNDLDSLAAQCLAAGPAPAGIRPLGPGRFEVYDGVYGSIKTALLEACSAQDAARWGCSNAENLAAPKLRDAFVYAHLALQARPNAFPHSEIDFGTFKWTAWGQQLVSEFGYGYIAQAVNRFDGRRFAQPDNNPVGHNTLVIREAFADGDDDINFSQLNWEAGRIDKTAGLGLPCMHLDGSDVYGARRENGWLRYMHRWACAVGTGSFVIVDSFAVQEDRQPLAIYGAAYGGPNFQEANRTVAGAQSLLTVDEYFHTPSWLQGTDTSGFGPEQTAFKRNLAATHCSHADVALGGDDASRATLRSRCGENGAEGDAVGEIIGWSRGGGRFVYDGLVSAEDRWGSRVLNQHRMRYEGRGRVGPAGEERVFLMTAGVAPGSPLPSWVRGSVAEGCAASSVRTCVEVCVGTRRYTFAVADGAVLSANETGGCDGQLNASNGSVSCSCGDAIPTPAPPTSSDCLHVQRWGSAAVAGCSAGLTWEQVLYQETLSPPTAWTGGLGRLMTDAVEVWVCVTDHPCGAAGGAPGASNVFCFVFDELAATFIPWGSNQCLGLV